MYKVLIVDDDEIIRDGLTQLINWSEYDLEICAAAANGIEALEVIQSNEIHIMITDIQMPEMDGITLLKEIRKTRSDIRCIVLSGYNDFEYVKQAAILGIENYILKPIDEKELISTLESTVNKLEFLNIHTLIDTSRSDILLNNILSRWASGNIDDFDLKERAEFLGFDIHSPEYQVAVISMQKPDVKDHAVIQALNKHIRHLALDKIHMIQFLDFQGFFVLLFSGVNLGDSNAKLREFFIQLTSSVENETKTTIFISVSGVANGYCNVHKAYFSAVSILNNAFLFGANKVIFQDEIDDLLSIKGKDNRAGNIVQKTKDYVEKNFAAEINLKVISYDLNMNAFYLGQLFKEKTGDSFTNYLNRFRIEKAVKLLTEGNFRVSEVASMVGYTNTNYFYILFKKIIGVSPSAFQK